MLAVNEEVTYSKGLAVLAKRRNISIDKARKIRAYRLLAFGDVDYFTVDSYAELFKITSDVAKKELEDIASMKQEQAPKEGQEEFLPGIQKIRDIVFSTEKADYIEVGNPIYTVIPGKNREEYYNKYESFGFWYRVA